MNEYNIKVNFEKGQILTNLKKLVQNDYNSTKLNFTFDKEGRVLFKLLYPDGTQYVDEIQNNELVFRPGILNQEGDYEYEIVLYTDDGRLTDHATKSFEVRSELVNTDELVAPDDRVPVLDVLINELNRIKKDIEDGKYNTNGGASLEKIKEITGELKNLNTEDKSNLVNAINEVIDKSCKITEITEDKAKLWEYPEGVYYTDKNVNIANGYATGSGYKIVVIGRATNGDAIVTVYSTNCIYYSNNKNQAKYYSFDNLALKTEVLTKTNTTSYTPTKEYHPATKKYVDDLKTESVLQQYSERIGHFVSNSGVNYEINTKTKEITVNDGFLFYLGQRQNDLQNKKTTLQIPTSSVFAYVVYDLKGTADTRLSCIVQADFDTTRHVLMCIIRSGYYTIPSANWIEGRYKVDGVLYNPAEPKEPIETVYVSTTGTDTNNETGDINHPFLTINKAINSGAKTIFVMAGTYKERITKSNSGGEIEIIAKPLNTTDKKDVIIDLGYELSMTADSTTGLVKGAYTSTADDFINKVFVTKEKPIKYVANNTENKEVSLGYTCNLWNGDTRLTPVLSLDECRTTSNSWYHDGTNIYANADAGTFILDNGTNQYGINLSYYKKVKLIGVTVKYASEIGAWLKGCSESEINRCKFLNTGVYHGLKLESTSSIVRNSKSAYSGKDGLNIHGVCTADFIDCISHDNLDDGISHHVESGGMVIGGEYYNNKKGGVCSPTFGSRNGINGVYVHNNGNGIYAVTEIDKEYPPCTISNCMIKENTIGIRSSRYTFNCWNNILLNNGTDTSEENGGVINICDGKYELIETIEVTEENINSAEFKHRLTKAMLYAWSGNNGTSLDAGIQAFSDTKIVAYAWISGFATSGKNRYCHFKVVKDGKIFECENTATRDWSTTSSTPSNSTVTTKAWKSESDSPITMIKFFGGSSKALPIGSKFELWGVRA